MLRCFEDGDVTHVSGNVDPVRDAEIVETELMLADLDSPREAPAQPARSGPRAATRKPPPRRRWSRRRSTRCATASPRARPALTDEERPVFQRLQLITAKPMMYVLNVEEGSAATGNAHSADGGGVRQEARHAVGRDLGRDRGRGGAACRPRTRASTWRRSGLKETGLARVVRAGYQLLDLVTFFTVGPKEARAWTVRREAKAPEAAGVIHTDFEKGFIRAETIAYDDYVTLNGEAGARDAGKLRLEGKEYAVKDGDVFHFRFNV